MRSVIVNTTPLIALSHIRHLDLLKKLYCRIQIPKAVYDEIQVKPFSVCAKNVKKSLDWIKVLEIKNQLAKELFKTQLHDGEVEVMILAKETDADLCIIDDANAKKFAKNLGLKVTGTLGVLLRAKTLGYISEVKPLLENMVSKGIYLSDFVINLCLKEAGES